MPDEGAMTGLTVVMDAEADALPGLGQRIGSGRVSAIGAIPDGTAAGLASVVVIVTLANGTTVLGETTLALLSNATRALAARYPDPRP